MPTMGSPSMMQGMQAHSAGQAAVTQPMTMVNPQPVMTQREAPPPPPPQEQDNNQSTWVIEEVIDFGVPLDEGLVRECDDTGYPLGCKSLGYSASPRGNVNLFDGCYHNVCYDEQQMDACQ